MLVLLFGYAAASKLLDIPQYLADMHRQPLPAWLVGALVWLVPLLEILVCAALLSVRTRKAGFWGAAVLLSVFTGYTVLALGGYFGKIPCSCGGIIKGLTWAQHAWLNLTFFTLAVAGLILEHKEVIAIHRDRRKPVTE